MGEVGVVCCGDEGECDGESGAPDGLSLVSAGVFALRRPPRGRNPRGSFGTFTGPGLETLMHGKTVLLAPVSDASGDNPQLCATGLTRGVTHAAFSFAFRRLFAGLLSSFSGSLTSGEASPLITDCEDEDGSVSAPVSVAVFVSDSMRGAVSSSKRDAAVAAAVTGFLASLFSG